MGDAAVSALVKEVVGRLTSLATQEFSLLRGLKDDILRLQKAFEQIVAVLEDAEEKHIKEKAVELWLRDLRSASMMVDNVLDEVSTEALLQRLHKQRGLKYRVRAFFSSNHNKYISRVRIAHKVEDIRRKLDVMASKRFELKLNPSDAISQVEDMGVESEMPDRETSSFIQSSNIFGREEEMEMAIEKICNKDIGNCDDGEIRVYGIWGMGGLGKTTLAQLIYNHERVNQYFEFKCWVYVSEKFQVKEIIKNIIESVDICGCEHTHLDPLQRHLKEKLQGKRFLIILDDVWIEDDKMAEWNKLSETLSCGIEGSTVVMTTRSKRTSEMMAKVAELQHELGCLSKDDSWLLFRKFAFAGREGDDTSELERIGRVIVEKCEGLPLAVKTLGSLLWSKRNTREWEHVKRNNIWELQDNKVLPALKLSYDNLAPHLKRCFAYCCLFPKGYKLKKDELIPMWVANGFIPPRGERDLYVLGEDIFNCLVWRSFFLVFTTYNYREVVTYVYKMHDLMHDMAHHVMRDDCLYLNPEYEVKIPNELFHLSFSFIDIHFSPQELKNLKSLRSMLMLEGIYESHNSQIFKHMYLRVLYLGRVRLSTFPESICKLKHLRYLMLKYSMIEVLPESIIYLQNLIYLNLSYSNITVLPESIIYLHNLQVLCLCWCKSLRKLPEGLRCMRKLLHLDINWCYSLCHLPIGIKELSSLRILSTFPVCNESGAKIGELRDLNLLEGELEIIRLRNVGGINEAKSANLKCKASISVLKLNWSTDWETNYEPERVKYDEDVLEGLEPNPCLKILTIQSYSGKIISPRWMVNLSNLVEITFYSCDNCVCIPPLGRLPNLRVITLESMGSLKCFHDDDTNMLGDPMDMFRCLQELNIERCYNLVSLPNNFPKLEVLDLRHSHRLRSLPNEIQNFKDLNELRICNCWRLFKRYNKETGVDWPKISHIACKIPEPSDGPSEDESEDEIDE